VRCAQHHHLRVEVLRARPTGGQGLLGLRERVAVYGGDLGARRRWGGGYRIRVRILLDRSS
jgi:signal transduction histidine kinase